ncbi:type IV pilus modification protein PilV [Pseudomonas sp. PS1]|uniref:Type IV pilus modification protein PilV n=1 Tax=Stutzerimonas marianensis TaxID=2929513 RepID=A0A9X1W544_9GAMM|nr:type IV pilus modification protein PilV [Pseudomonas marianensis]MCJ0973724.1 type IV pilus modification protein PilV [Pseudomonas marianensis]
MFKQTDQRGFSMIEVLVAIIIISIGVLGLVAMQGKTIQYTQDASQRNVAAMLASDLMELVRSNRNAVFAPSGELSNNSNYYKSLNESFPTAGVAACRTASGCTSGQMATDHLFLWTQQVRNSLPIDDNTLATYLICRDSTPDTVACDNLGSAIKIRTAWLSRNSDCPANTPCANAGAVDSANRREFYQISFEP